MNSKDLYKAIGKVDNDILEQSEAPGRAPGKAPKGKVHFIRRYWKAAVAAVLALTITGGILFYPSNGTPMGPIALAAYPEMSSYPTNSNDDEAYDAWREDVEAQRRDLGDTSSLEGFFAKSAQVFLRETRGGNRTYSPLNIYMALSMLAQVTDGESRKQILTALGSESVDALRQQANDVWNANYRDDGQVTSILSSSLWLNQNIKYNQDTMDILAKDFYASSYQGEMGSDEYNMLMRDWLNEQTEGELEEEIKDFALSPSTIMALGTAINFKAGWYDEFMEDKTASQTFHASSGDVETDFMHQSDERGDYYWGERFSAIGQSMVGSGAMWFLLPEEGVSPEELLADEEAMEFLFSTDPYAWEKKKTVVVNKSIPKFDISSEFDLIEEMQELGITAVFEPGVADFTPMTTDVRDPIALSQASHAARVNIDEKGCDAAAFTVMEANATGAWTEPDEEVDFVLDRPFLFCITGESGLPLFVGIVNSPVDTNKDSPAETDKILPQLLPES